MKKSTHIFRNLVNGRFATVAVLIAIMLCVTSSAVAITFGIKGNYGMPSLNMIAMIESPTNTFKYTFTASGTGDNYVKFYKNQQDGNSTCVTTSANVSPVTYGTEYSCTVGNYKEFKMAITSGTTYTCTVVYTNDSNVKVTITSGCSATTPTVTTSAAASVGTSTATLGGNVTAAGQTASCTAQTVSGRGIEWVSGTGKTAGTKESAGSGTGSFTVNTTGLTPGTTYRYKAYATNAAGTSYGSNVSFTTASASAPVVRIGNEISENESNYSVDVSAYVSRTGCSPIDKFKIFYSKTRNFSIESTKEVGASVSINNATTLNITASEIESAGIVSGDSLFVRIKGHNEAGLYSADYSDIVAIKYLICAYAISSVSIEPASGQVASGHSITLTANADNETEYTTYTWTGSATGTGKTKTIENVTSNLSVRVTASENQCSTPTSAYKDETYTVCNGIGALSLDCPGTEQPVGTPITINATLTTGTADSWEWYLNGDKQSSTTTSMTFTPTVASNYTVKCVANGCPNSVKKTEICTIQARSSFTKNNLEKSFTACKDNHSFTWSEMFTPAPDEWSAKIYGSETDATSEFSLTGGVMTWNPGSKSSGTYKYTFTAIKEGYITTTATLQITYSKTSTSQTIGDITASVTTTTPWTAVTLSSSFTSGQDIEKIGWTVSPASLVAPTNNTGTTAYFKGKALSSSKEYTITARGLTSNCGEGPAKTIKITVNPDTEVCD